MSQRSWLKKESELWVKKGIISHDQAGQIIQLYPDEHRNRLISTLLVLGAVLLGVGVILFFASNWQSIPKWGKVGLVIVPLVLFHLSSFLTYSKYLKISATLSLLGCLMFGSGIWLIAQIFHINSHFPNGILFWLLGTLPVAYLLKEELSLGLSALLLGAWVVAEHSPSLTIILTATFLFALVFYLTYALRSVFALAVTLLSSIVFIVTETISLSEQNYTLQRTESLIPFVMLLVGRIAVYMAKQSVNEAKYFSLVYDVVGLITVGISLYAMSFEYFARSFLQIQEQGQGLLLLWSVYAISVLAVLYIMSVISRQGNGFKTIVKENSLWLALDMLALAMLLIPFSKLALMITLNVFMFFWALSIIVLGNQRQNILYFTLGMIAFNVFIVTEYFNFFWRMLPKSLFFMVGGIVLIAGGALMERQRRKVIYSWQVSEVIGIEKKL